MTPARSTNPDASRDAVLLLGPLYHLLDRAERVRALSEARRGTQNVPNGFTTAYFHRPEDIEREIADRLADPDQRALLLELLARAEREPTLVGATAHLLAVARG